MIPFPQRLQKAREEKGLSQDKLGEVIGKGRLQVMRWENGKAEPKFQDLERLGEALGRPVAWFFATDQDQERPSLQAIAALHAALSDASQIVAGWLPEQATPESLKPEQATPESLNATHLPTIGPRPRIGPGIPQRRPADQTLNRAAKDD